MGIGIQVEGLTKSGVIGGPVTRGSHGDERSRLTKGAIIGSHPVGRSVSEGEHVSGTLWVTAVIHDWCRGAGWTPDALGLLGRRLGCRAAQIDRGVTVSISEIVVAGG